MSPASAFWLLEVDPAPARRAEWAEEVELESRTCPIDDGHQRGGRRLTNLSVILPRPPLEDFIQTWKSEVLVQDEVRKALRAKGFTGVRFKPVKGQSVDRTAPSPRFWELTVCGWGGVAKPQSGIRQDEFCPACLHSHFTPLKDPRKLIDAAQWDGSDFFLIWPMPAYVFVTERVVLYVQQANWSGVHFLPAGKIPRSEIGFSPGLIQDWLPRAVARRVVTSPDMARLLRGDS